MTFERQRYETMTEDSSTAALQRRIRELEEELARREPRDLDSLTRQKYLESVLHHAPDAIVTLDASHRVMEWNPGAQRIFGYTVDEARGRDLDDLVSRPDVDQEARGNTRTVLSGQTLKPAEAVRYRKDGSPVQVIASGAPIMIEGMLLGVVAIYSDITRIKELESQFQQAQKLEAVGRLAGGIAHDLNNLLTPILGYSDLMLNTMPSRDPSKSKIESILSAAEKARDLVGQLLAYSRKQTLEFKTLDLNTLIQDFEALLRKTIREDIELRLNLDPSIPCLQADKGQLEQLLLNLAINARDAMPEHGRLTIETSDIDLDRALARSRYGLKPGRHLLLTVSDTGHGMDPETQLRIFEPFFTTKEQGKGTGLGLAMVYGIVKQHGGSIWVSSEPGHGSTFTVCLPAVEEPVSSLKDEPRPPQETQGTETVMVVEDNDMVRDLAAAVLEKNGYTVFSTSHGQECLHSLDRLQGKVDLLLADVIMPDMNGRELFRTASGLYPWIRVLYMSGYTDDAIGHHGVLNNGVAFIQKPFTVKALAQKVRSILDEPRPSG